MLRGYLKYLRDQLCSVVSFPSEEAILHLAAHLSTASIEEASDWEAMSIILTPLQRNVLEGIFTCLPGDSRAAYPW